MSIEKRIIEAQEALTEGLYIRGHTDAEVKKGVGVDWRGEAHLRAEWRDGILRIEIANRGKEATAINIRKPEEIEQLQSVLFQLRGEESDE